MQIIKNKNIKWWLGLTSCLILFAFIGFFAYTKTSFLLKGVQIIANIERTDTSSVATIKGTVAHATYVSLNGREIFIDKDGNFKEPIALIPGFSVITIDTHDKFGKTKEKKFQVVYNKADSAVAFNN